MEEDLSALSVDKEVELDRSNQRAIIGRLT